jgi:hypothetical protein
MTVPIEIKELVIRAVVQQEAGQSSGDATAESRTTMGHSAATEEHEAIVAAAVKEVLRILKASKER